jgi:2-(1,2-epoxy-1,2-dihydrophenyl)acetyl-CoA isomerase
MSAADQVQTEMKDGVLTITLDHPKVNAFTMDMIASTRSILKDAGHNDEIRCVLLIGRGKYFSTGHDLNEVYQAKGQSFRGHLVRTFNPLILQIRNLQKPVIAGINGAVAGASLGIALACDLRIAADDALFTVGFLGVGLTLDSGVSLFLPKLIGLSRATEFAFTNAPITARQALEWGLVNRLAPAKQLVDQAHEWARELSGGPSSAIGLTKRLLNKAVFPNLTQVLDYEAHYQDIAGSGDESKEGLQAFLEKRAPNFN